MSSKKRGDAKCCEKKVIHGVVFLKDGIEFEYDGNDDNLDEYVLSIIGTNSKEEAQQALLNTSVDQSKNLETDNDELQKKVKAKKTKSDLMEDLFLDDFFEPRPFHIFLDQLSIINQQ
ncbi:hypothetical protein ACOSQ2_017489 [Xanthoceras sorbifolium]